MKKKEEKVLWCADLLVRMQGAEAKQVGVGELLQTLVRLLLSLAVADNLRRLSLNQVAQVAQEFS